jgi:hypothetical protein
MTDSFTKRLVAETGGHGNKTKEWSIKRSNDACHWFRRQVEIRTGAEKLCLGGGGGGREIARDSFKRYEMDDSSVMDGRLTSPIIPAAPASHTTGCTSIGPHLRRF